ncbi:hypothetical protein CDAR_12841, partial [Caerostris darwini]
MVQGTPSPISATENQRNHSLSNNHLNNNSINNFNPDAATKAIFVLNELINIFSSMGEYGLDPSSSHQQRGPILPTDPPSGEKDAAYQKTRYDAALGFVNVTNIISDQDLLDKTLASKLTKETLAKAEVEYRAALQR